MKLRPGGVVGLTVAAGAWISSGWSSLIPEDQLGYLTSGMLFAFRIRPVVSNGLCLPAAEDARDHGRLIRQRLALWGECTARWLHYRRFIGAVRNRVDPLYPTGADAAPWNVHAIRRRNNHAGHYANCPRRRGRLHYHRVPGCTIARHRCHRHDDRRVYWSQAHEARACGLAKNVHGAHPDAGRRNPLVLIIDPKKRTLLMRVRHFYTFSTS